MVNVEKIMEEMKRNTAKAEKAIEAAHNRNRFLRFVLANPNEEMEDLQDEWQEVLHDEEEMEDSPCLDPPPWAYK